MFRPEEIQARLRQQPFRPFRIVASEGLRYDIYHPELVMVGERDLAIGLPGPGNGPIYQRLVMVALMHVVALEQLPAKTANGPAS